MCGMMSGNPVRSAERMGGTGESVQSLWIAEKGFSCDQMELLSPKLNKIFILFNLLRVLKTSSPAEN